VGDIARKGSFALLLFSLVSFAGSIVLPLIVASPGDDEPIPAKWEVRGSESIFGFLRVPRIDICTAWGLSQLLFSGSLMLAPAMSSYWIVSLVIAFCGL
jgi:solute carrier family 45 protein 1/2/4